MKRSYIFVGVIVGILLAAAISMAKITSGKSGAIKDDEVPLAVIKHGEMDLQVHATGELSASHVTMLTAPAIGGDALQITKLVRSGATVKKGDIVIEFDPSGQHYKLEQNRSELLQAEQEITKAKAGALVLAAQDKVALLKARYDVRRAELEVQKNELVSKIDADKNQLALQQAKRVLAELEKDAQSHTASGQASTFLAQEKYNKAKLAMDQAQQNIEKMRVVAPMDGLVSIQKNMDAAGGFFFPGMSLPDYHAGDQAQPGSSIAQVVDPNEMNLVSKVSEKNHSNVVQGQAVEVSFDALPGQIFPGTVKSVGGMTTKQFFDDDAGGSFDVSVQLSNMDRKLRSGFTAQIVFMGSSKKNVLYIPRQALFLKEGKRIVFVKDGSRYDQREVKVQNESESRAAVEGLKEGNQVALIDPTVPRKVSVGGGSANGGTGGTP